MGSYNEYVYDYSTYDIRFLWAFVWWSHVLYAVYCLQLIAMLIEPWQPWFGVLVLQSQERDDALKQIRIIHDESCRENAKRSLARIMGWWHRSGDVKINESK